MRCLLTPTAKPACGLMRLRAKLRLQMATGAWSHSKTPSSTPAITGQRISWPESFEIETLNGYVTFGSLQIDRFLEDDWEIRTSLGLKDVDLLQLGFLQGYGEPSSLSANLHEITLNADRLHSYGGIFVAKAFNGTITVSDIEVSDPLTEYPVWSSDIQLQELDFEAVTTYFGFGLIRGKLSGRITNFELDCTQSQIIPLRFDLDLYSSPNEFGGLSREALEQIIKISEHPAMTLTMIGSNEFGFSRLRVRSELNKDGFRIWGGLKENGEDYDSQTDTGPCYFVIPRTDFMSWFTVRNRLTFTLGHPDKLVSFTNFWERLNNSLENAGKTPPKVKRGFRVPLFDALMPFDRDKGKEAQP